MIIEVIEVYGRPNLFRFGCMSKKVLK